MLEAVRATRQTVAKRRQALSDEVRLDNILATRDFRVEQEPFPHLVVDDVFVPKFYMQIEDAFSNVLNRGLSEVADRQRFHPFLELRKKGAEWEYDGYVYVPAPHEHTALAPLYSLEWNLLFSQLFRQPTDWSTSLAFHHHPPGNRTGFVHNDYSHKNFSLHNRLPNGMVYREIPNPRFNDPAIFTTMRIIALLFYVGADVPRSDDGGGTGLYGARGLNPIKVIEPRPNRLLAFQISPRSFHAFQTNNRNRNSIAQWFHMTPSWCEKKYGYA